MQQGNTVRTDEHGLPWIDASEYYDTSQAARLLATTADQLRQWRHKKLGPKYYKPEQGRCKYLGLWLIEFRRGSVVEPAQ